MKFDILPQPETGFLDIELPVTLRAKKCHCSTRLDMMDSGLMPKHHSAHVFLSTTRCGRITLLPA